MQCDVVLVVSPFAVINCPLVGPSVLAPQLRDWGISASVYYANIVLASEIGPTAYDRFTDIDTPGGGIIGEALFSHWARCGDLGLEEAWHEIGLMVDAWERRREMVGAKAMELEFRQVRSEVARCFDAIPGFLDRTTADILSYSPKVVGFHTSEPHLTSAVALARRLKVQAPDLVTVMGGPHATSPMGAAIREACGVFDFVFSGEADLGFPRFVKNYFERGALPHEKVVECAPIARLDDASVPDFDDYFRQMAHAFPSERDGKDLVAGLLFEASRSCWWGATKPCTFCGLDSPPSPTRIKSPGRVIEEIRTLTKRYGINKLHTADVAFPKEYFKTVLPKLAAESDNCLDLELNVRPDLRLEELDAMRRAGVTGLLCGIESFSTPLLQKMNKGVTARQNLCLLRDCLSRGIQVRYLLLMGVPGEDPEEYRAMIRLMPRIVHLQPPSFLVTIGIVRSSTYFAEPEKYGITGIRPSHVYHFRFGDQADLNSLAYTFEATIPSEFLHNQSLREEFTACVNRWCDAWKPGNKLPLLRRVPVLPGQDAVQDTRPCAIQEFYVPDKEELELLDYLATPRRRCDVPGGSELCLHNLLERNFVLDWEGLLINIVTSLEVDHRAMHA